jgi:hypothetical protein
MCISLIQIGADIWQTATRWAFWSNANVFVTPWAHTFFNNKCYWIIVLTLTVIHLFPKISPLTRHCIQLLAERDHVVGSRLLNGLGKTYCAGMTKNFNMIFFLICVVGLWVLRPLLASCTNPWMIGEGHCGEISGMKIGSGNQTTQRKPAPVPLCQPQIPHDQTRV